MPRISNCQNCKCGLDEKPEGSYCTPCWSARLKEDGSFEKRSRTWAEARFPKARIDIDYNQLDTFLKKVARCGSGYGIVDCTVVTRIGPGGGNPVVDIFARDRNEIREFLLDYYDPAMIEQDFALYTRAA